jgi:hypothetical protein
MWSVPFPFSKLLSEFLAYALMILGDAEPNYLVLIRLASDSHLGPEAGYCDRNFIEFLSHPRKVSK